MSRIRKRLSTIRKHAASTAKRPRPRVGLTAAWLVGALIATPVRGQQPMGLQDCVHYARMHSRDLAKLRLALESQELTTLIARGKFRPLLSGSAEHGTDDGNTSGSATLKQEVPAGLTASATARAEDGGDKNVESAGLSVALSKVLLGNGSWAASMLEIDNSVLDELADRNRVHRYERELAFRVIERYYALVRNHQTLHINELRLERARKNLEHAIARERPLDIATARIEVPENEAGVLSAKRLIQTKLDEMKLLIGMDVGEEIQVDTAFAFQERKLDVDRDVAFCLANHEDILNARLEQEKLENEWPVQRARRWPEVTLSAGADMDSKDGINLGGDTAATFGLSFSWEAGGRTERLKAERIDRNINTKKIDVDDLKQQKTKSIRDLARRIDETLQLCRLQEQKVTVSERRSELYEDRWQNGEIDILEYIRSQNDLENSRIQLINLQTTYMELLGEYEFTVGR